MLVVSVGGWEKNLVQIRLAKKLYANIINYINNLGCDDLVKIFLDTVDVAVRGVHNHPNQSA